MNEAVRQAFYDFNAPLEGVISWPYLDVRGLVTVGVGCLIDPITEATPLPFYRLGSGMLAAKTQVRVGWNIVKAHHDLADNGARAFEALTDLRLNPAAIEALVDKRLLANEKRIKLNKTFSKWETYPADAQMAILSMAWAIGPDAFPRWPKFSIACAIGNFEAAAFECKIDTTGNPGIIPRNALNKALLLSAATTNEPDILHLPKETS